MLPDMRGADHPISGEAVQASRDGKGSCLSGTVEHQGGLLCIYHQRDLLSLPAKA